MNSDNDFPIRHRSRSRSPPRTSPPSIEDCIREICRRGLSCASKDNTSKERLRMVLTATVNGVMKSQEPGATMSEVARAGRLSHSLFPNIGPNGEVLDHWGSRR